MDSTGLHDHFRSQVFDTAKPYLWETSEVWVYATDALRMFARLTGGIPDVTSDHTRVSVVVGESSADLSKLILAIDEAHLVSDGSPVKIVNYTDLVGGVTTDYGFLTKNVNKPVDGDVRYMLLGRQKHLAEWCVLPVTTDEVQMSIKRLPETEITDDEQSLDEIEDEHHIHLIDWMKHLAYRKDDIETFDLNKSKKAEETFRSYCWQVKSEIGRMKHKPRAVQYGGL